MLRETEVRMGNRSWRDAVSAWLVCVGLIGAVAVGDALDAQPAYQTAVGSAGTQITGACRSAGPDTVHADTVAMGPTALCVWRVARTAH